MPKQMVELDIPDGYEFVRFDHAKMEELYISSRIEVWNARHPSACKYVIVREDTKYRDIKWPDDWNKEVEFSDDGFKNVVTGRLAGYASGTHCPYIRWDTCIFAEARIKDTP